MNETLPLLVAWINSFFFQFKVIITICNNLMIESIHWKPKYNDFNIISAINEYDGGGGIKRQHVYFSLRLTFYSQWLSHGDEKVIDQQVNKELFNSTTWKGYFRNVWVPWLTIRHGHTRVLYPGCNLYGNDYQYKGAIFSNAKKTIND